MTTSEHKSDSSHFESTESDDDFDDDDEWISEFLKQDKEAVNDTYSEPLPDIITVPEPEREYTDLFQRLFVDGISMKPAVLSAIFENTDIKSVSLGFSKNKPILRISSSTQVNSTLIDSVTTLLGKYISEHHKSHCDKNEIEKMIKISLERPMQVAEFQGGIPGGEFIMT